MGLSGNNGQYRGCCVLLPAIRIQLRVGGLHLLARLGLEETLHIKAVADKYR